MSRFTVFNIVLLAVYAASLAVGLVLAFRLEPLSGDLTRIGGYSENDFGWHSPQFGLARPGARLAKADRAADVVVLGDSFSIGVNESFRSADGRQTYHRWTDFFGARTGLDIALYHLDDFDVEKVMASSAYRRVPPKLFVYEVTERSLEQRLGGVACVPPTASAPPHPFGLTSRQLAIVPVDRARRTETLRPQVGYAYSYLYTSAQRRLGFHSEVRDLRLDRSDLFSNQRSADVLLYGQDFLKAAWTPAQWTHFGCALQSLRQLVERDGRTSFLVLIVPDKLTAYSPYLRDREWAGVSRLSQLLDQTELPTIRLDHSVAQLIASGRKDIYLPNDTHWGPFMHRQAADEVYGYLPNRRVIAPPQSTAVERPQARASIRD